MPSKIVKRGWDRESFNVRLTKKRAMELKAIATELGDHATPVEAVDFALTRAARALGSEATRDLELAATVIARNLWSELESALADWQGKQELVYQNCALAAKVEKLDCSLTALRALMEKVAMDEI